MRGVVVSTNIVRTLLERNWIRVVGHRDVPGKPAMFGTTKEFLDYFGLKKLEELPTLAEIKDGLPELSPQTDLLESLEADARGVDAVLSATTRTLRRRHGHGHVVPTTSTASRRRRGRRLELAGPDLGRRRTPTTTRRARSASCGTTTRDDAERRSRPTSSRCARPTDEPVAPLAARPPCRSESTRFSRMPGIGSRRSIERWVAEGRITVDGRVAKLGEQLQGRERVCFDGKPIRLDCGEARARRHDDFLAYYKPGATRGADEDKAALDVAAAASRALDRREPARPQHVGPARC